jgi:hypothetical protein
MSLFSTGLNLKTFGLIRSTFCCNLALPVGLGSHRREWLTELHLLLGFWSRLGRFPAGLGHFWLHSGTSWTEALVYWTGTSATAHVHIRVHTRTHTNHILVLTAQHTHCCTHMFALRSRQDLGRGIAVGLFGANSLINFTAAAVYLSFGQAISMASASRFMHRQCLTQAQSAHAASEPPLGCLGTDCATSPIIWAHPRDTSPLPLLQPIQHVSTECSAPITAIACFPDRPAPPRFPSQRPPSFLPWLTGSSP